VLDHRLVDHHLADVLQRRQLVHRVEQHRLDDRAQAARAGLALERLAGDRGSASWRNSSSTPSISNSLRNCLLIAFFGSVRIFTSAASSSSSRVATTGRRPTNSGNQAELDQVFGSTSASTLPAVGLALGCS
jgi:hypothetical protein